MAVFDPEKRKRLLENIAAEKNAAAKSRAAAPQDEYKGEYADLLKQTGEGLASSILGFNSKGIPSSLPNLSGRTDGLTTFIPDLTKYGSKELAGLTSTMESEKKRLLEDAAKPKYDTTDMQNLMQPSQEFQQQMKGREVALRRAAGDGLGAQAAMQDPNYVLGSGSSLRKKPEPLAPDWARMNRSARRLKRQGYLAQAGQMASLAEIERLGTPNFMTQDQRNRMTYMGMERDAKEEEQRRQADLSDMYLRKRQQQALDSMS